MKFPGLLTAVAAAAAGSAAAAVSGRRRRRRLGFLPRRLHRLRDRGSQGDGLVTVTFVSPICQGQAATIIAAAPGQQTFGTEGDDVIVGIFGSRQYRRARWRGPGLRGPRK